MLCYAMQVPLASLGARVPLFLGRSIEGVLRRRTRHQLKAPPDI
jgi:hypothetical protein